MQTRPQLENELYQIVKFKDPGIWQKILWQKYGERYLKSLEHAQLVEFVELVKKEYVAKTVSN